MMPLFQTANGIASEVTVARDRAEADVIAAKEGHGVELLIWDTQMEETNPNLSKPKPRGKEIHRPREV